MRLDACWVDVDLCFGEGLRRKLVHLLVGLSSLGVDVSLLLEGRFGEAELLSFVEHLSFLDKSTLQLSRLGIESVVVSPFLFKHKFLVPHACKCTHECKHFQVSEVAMHGNLSCVVDSRDLSKLKKCGSHHEAANIALVLGESLVLKKVFIFERVFTGVEEP